MNRLRTLIDQAIQLIDDDPVHVIDSDSYVIVGDTHGYPEVSRLALRLREEEGHPVIVFLGDYVDRGPNNLGNLEVVLEAFLSGGVVLLRGNHESLIMNKMYGLADEVIAKGSEEILEDLARLYTRLQYIAIDTRRMIILLHGGIPCRNCSNTEEEPYTVHEIQQGIIEARRRGEDLEPVQGPAFHVLWNDPMGHIDWFSPSPRGAYYYGKQAWTRFLEANKLTMIIRGHEVADAGFIWTPSGSRIGHLQAGWSSGVEQLRGSVFTLFSSLYHGRRAGILVVEGEKLRLYTTRGASLSP